MKFTMGLLFDKEAFWAALPVALFSFLVLTCSMALLMAIGVIMTEEVSSSVVGVIAAVVAVVSAAMALVYLLIAIELYREAKT